MASRRLVGFTGLTTCATPRKISATSATPGRNGDASEFVPVSVVFASECAGRGARCAAAAAPRAVPGRGVDGPAAAAKEDGPAAASPGAGVVFPPKADAGNPKGKPARFLATMRTMGGILVFATRRHSAATGARKHSSSTSVKHTPPSALARTTRSASSRPHHRRWCSVWGNRLAKSPRFSWRAPPAFAARPMAAPNASFATTETTRSVATRRNGDGSASNPFLRAFEGPNEARSPGTSNGIESVIVVPTPTADSHETDPPNARTMFEVMARPRPVPPYSRVLLALAWPKGRKTTPSLSSEMPMPVSSTRNRTVTRRVPEDPRANAGVEPTPPPRAAAARPRVAGPAARSRAPSPPPPPRTPSFRSPRSVSIESPASQLVCRVTSRRESNAPRLPGEEEGRRAPAPPSPAPPPPPVVRRRRREGEGWSGEECSRSPPPRPSA